MSFWCKFGFHDWRCDPRDDLRRAPYCASPPANRVCVRCGLVDLQRDRILATNRRDNTAVVTAIDEARRKRLP